MRGEEQRIKKVIKEELAKFSNKQAEQTKILKQLYSKSVKEQEEAYIKRKIEDSKRIAQEAELQSHKNIQAFNEEFERLHEKNIKTQKNLLSQAISEYYAKFSHGYEKVTILLKNTDKDNLKNMQKHNESLKATISMFDELIAKVKSNNIGPAELQSAELLVRNINELEVNLAKEIEAYAAEKLAKEKETAAPKPPTEPAVPQNIPTVVQPTTPVVEVPVPVVQPPPPPPPAEEPDSAAKIASSNQFVHPDRLQFYNQIMENYHQKVESVKPLQVS